MARGNLPSALALLQKLQPAIQRNDRAATVDLIRQLAALRAPLGQQWVQLAYVAAANGEASLARTVIDLHVKGAPDDPGAPFRKVELLAYLGEWSEVLRQLRKLPHTLPNPVQYAYVRGTAALYCGEKDEARHWLEEAIRLFPQGGSPWLSLSVLVDFAEEPELAERVIAHQPTMESAHPDGQGAYFYALGKVHADRGEHALAFAAYSRGAALVRNKAPYSRERDRFTAEDAVNGYDGKRVAAIAAQQSEPTGRGMLVTGLPRSGTTLVEQILTSHSEVSDGGEIYRLGLLVKDIGGLSHDAVRQFVDAGGAPEAARLWRHWLDERFPAPGRVVDKTLNNSRMLGLAATLLPEAPLVWLTRDPLDCAWSCFRTHLSGDGQWSYDLDDIGYHFRLERDLLQRWQEILGDRLLVVPYESLAGEPEPWIRRILAHCGLPEEPAPFAPHENRRTVTTTSTMQVRRPINRAGIGSAEPYRDYLEPFSRAYG
jgi:tetratricopeptide (TPR) repeat protein